MPHDDATIKPWEIIAAVLYELEKKRQNWFVLYVLHMLPAAKGFLEGFRSLFKQQEQMQHAISRKQTWHALCNGQKQQI